jgi:hypothetical protein
VSDEIVLTLPRDRDFYDVAHLVVGGLAVRLDLTIEHLEDLQLALDGLLPQDGREGDVTVALRLDDDAITARIGPFERNLLQQELERDEDGRPGLDRVLKTVSDGYEVEDEGGSAWVVLRKAVA